MLGELVRQLPGGGDDESEHSVGILGEEVEERKRKRRRFAATGLGDAQDVLAGEDFGNAVALDGSRFLHAELFAGFWSVAAVLGGSAAELVVLGLCERFLLRENKGKFSPIAISCSSILFLSDRSLGRELFS
nr:hypothetical protein Iba_chr02cCG14170 [Ipomoea batatas]